MCTQGIQPGIAPKLPDTIPILRAALSEIQEIQAYQDEKYFSTRRLFF
jgi:hypothetical protein